MPDDPTADDANEILAAARAAAEQEAAANEARDAARKRRWQIGTLGLGAAIGSAAVAAAVLFANRGGDGPGRR